MAAGNRDTASAAVPSRNLRGDQKDFRRDSEQDWFLQEEDVCASNR